MATMVVPYRDVNAQNKQYMMMLAQLLGERGQEATQQDRMAALAESLVPQPTSTINDQRLFSDQGFDALRGNVLEGTPAAFGQAPGQPLNQMQILQKALSSGLPIQDAMSVVRGMQPAKPTLSSNLLKLIEKKLAADPEFEGSPEHLRLLKVPSLKTETPEEKLKRLQALRKSAAGQYFGIEGGNPQPLFPKVFEYAEKEIAKLPMFAKQPETVDITPQVDELPETTKFPRTAAVAPPGAGKASVKPSEYPDAVWSPEHGMWVVVKDGRLMGVQ